MRGVTGWGWRWGTAIVLVGVAAGCGSSSTGPGGRTACSPPLSIGPTTFTEGAPSTISATYTASVTGDGTITSLTYVGASGQVTVTNPVLPFSVDATVPLPTQAGMSASGYYTNGTVTIAYQASVGASDDEQTNQVCGGSNN
jgi:hypothetical protein